MVVKLLYSLAIVIAFSSCAIVEDYKFSGQETMSGTIEHEFHLHEHFQNADSTHHCFYYHDTITEDWEITFERIVKTRKLTWKKR